MKQFSMSGNIHGCCVRHEMVSWKEIISNSLLIHFSWARASNILAVADAEGHIILHQWGDEMVRPFANPLHNVDVPAAEA
jgi:hypothetical protein